MTVDGNEVFEGVGYQYWPAKREVGTEEWIMLGGTNRASKTEPYATPYGANYRIALEKNGDSWRKSMWSAERFQKEFEYTVFRRPFGAWEEVNA